VILTAAYILWAIQRVYLGAEYRGPHEDALKPITPRELSIATPLVFLAILFGVAPQLLFQYVTPSVNQQVENLANWTRDVHDGARKMVVAEGDHGLPDSEGVVTRAEITSGEIASRWAQD
jgi:NADH-quinone oxidoreductase subunit M